MAAQLSSSVRPTLGAFRFFLALTVFFSHVNARPDLFSRLSGIHGVVMFFVVSGFLIGWAIEGNYVNRIGGFLFNRFLRIYPAFWAVLGLTTVLIVLHGRGYIQGQPPDWMSVSIQGWDTAHFIQALILVDGYPGTVWNVMPVAWSLVVEMWFYLVIAALYWGLNIYYGPRAAVMRGRGVVIACWVALAIYLSMASTIVMAFQNPIAYIPDFVLGVAVSRAVLGLDRPWVDGTLIAVSLLLALFGFCHIDPALPAHLLLTTPISVFADKFTFHTGYNVLSLMILMAFFAFGVCIDAAPRARLIDNFLGNITYPLYLCHLAIVATVNQDLPSLTLGHRVTLAFGLSLCVAMLLYWLVDRRLTTTRLQIRSTARRAVREGNSAIAATAASESAS
jgi:peptidoglycan/LPS O-acetylase OafA/YrhL